MTSLAGKIAIVTGASSGIGEATATALAARQVKLVLAARRMDRLEALVNRIEHAGGEAVAVACDVCQRDQVEAAVLAAMKSWGGIDILINNAGVMPLAPMLAARFDDWDRMLDINIRGPLNMIGYVLPIMHEQKSGHIINVSSVAGRLVFPNAAVYCGTKFALHAISEGLRSELAELSQKDGNTIRVTVIAPGFVATELADSVTDEATRSGLKAYLQTMPYPLQSQDIAQAIIGALEMPEHVGVNEVMIRPVSQIR